MFGFTLALIVLDHAARYLYAPATPSEASGAGTLALLGTQSLTRASVPIVVLLAGLTVSRRYGSDRPGLQSRRLVTHGLCLIVAELTVVRGLAWFTFDYISVLGVLELFWVVGASMLLLAVLVQLPRRDLIAFAALVIVLHNVFDGVVMPGAYGPGTAPGALGKLWIVLHQSGDVFRLVGTSGPAIAVAYPILPLAGVMAAGYASGPLYQLDEERRVTWMSRVGWGMLAAFLTLRSLDSYGDSNSWSAQAGTLATIVSFLSPTPFPPSLHFLLLVLGPTLLILVLLEKHPSWLRQFALFGRAPVFVYLAQLFIVHVLAFLFTFAVGRDTSYLFVSEPFAERPPEGAGFNLPVVYACWAGALLVVHRLTTRYARMRGTS